MAAGHTGPKFPETPIDLLTVNHVEEPFFFKYWSPLVFGSITFAAVCFGNYATKRPSFAGIQKHIFFTGVAAWFGTKVESWRRDYLANRDAIFKHYVELHPEDFPPFKSRKLSEVLDPWVPAR